MNHKSDFILKDKCCSNAIENFKTLISVSDWLNQYSDLFNSVSITPEGLPRITSINFGGESFENIRQFSRLYDIIFNLYF